MQNAQSDPISSAKEQEQVRGVFHQDYRSDSNRGQGTDDQTGICVEVLEIKEQITTPAKPIRSEMSGSGLSEKIIQGSAEIYEKLRRDQKES